MPAANWKSSGRRRLPLLLTAAFCAVACLTFGLIGASAAPLQPTTTTFTITDTATGQPITGAIKPDEEVTLTATVTGSSSYPNGTIGFQNTTSNTPLCDSGGNCSWAVGQTGPTTAQGSVSLYLPSGTYNLQAAFRPASGSGFLPSSSSSASITVATQRTLTTATTLSVSPNPITEGGSATLTATITSADGSIPHGMVTFYSTNGNTKTFIQEATLDANGQASIIRSDWAVGNISLEADYLGDTFVDVNGDTVQWLSSSNSPLDPVSLTINPPSSTPTTTTTPTGTTLTDLPDARAYVGRTATLSARLLDSGGNPLANETVTLTANDAAGTSCSAQTDATGLASCTASFPAAGTFTVTAAFEGAGGYTASSDSSQQIEIDTVPTAVTYTGATTTASGSQVTLSGRLVDTLASAPIQGQTLTLMLNGNAAERCSGTTDATGLASCAVTVGEPGSTTPYPVSVSYAGSGTYGASSGTGSLTVTVPTTLTYAGASQIVRGNKATLAATLLAAGQPLAGQVVTLTLASGESCSATTNAAGLASCQTTTAVNGLGGPDAVSLSFAGGGIYAASTGSGTLIVLVPTTTSMLATAPVLQGASAKLSATLTTSGGPLGGRTVTLSLGAQSCTATTTATGTATCTISGVTALLGPGTTGASFAGSTYYLPSSGAGSTYVYGMPKGGGSFVVGDQSDTGSVTFWGSQWWKVNSLSGGGDPSSFKGFAANVPSLACGGTWSTDPGNSSPPPAAPLPAYMAVIVSSNNTKSGSQISGNIAAVVIVKTDAGYEANPGHAGTGTVVATLCTSGS